MKDVPYIFGKNLLNCLDLKNRCFDLSILILISFVTFQEVNQVKVTSYKIIGKTATGIITNEVPEPFVAISRDLLEKYPLGSYIYLSNCKWEGLYKVLDKMGRRKRNTIDVWSNQSNTGHVNCDCAAVK